MSGYLVIDKVEQMGIQGLLKVLEPICEDISLSDLRGLKVAVDGLCWLHKGLYTCAYELGTNIKTDRHITFCMERTKLLLHYDITPIIVFDGGYLPSKRGTEREREMKREEAKAKGMELVKAGTTFYSSYSFVTHIDTISPLFK